MNKDRQIVQWADIKNVDKPLIEFKRPMTEAERIRKKVGRNAPCVCGSGKKLKRCCLKKLNSKYYED